MHSRGMWEKVEGTVETLETLGRQNVQYVCGLVGEGSVRHHLTACYSGSGNHCGPQER